MNQSTEIVLSIVARNPDPPQPPTLHVAREIMQNLHRLDKDANLMVGVWVACPTAHTKASEIASKNTTGVTCLFTFPHPDPTISESVQSVVHQADSYSWPDGQGIQPDSPDANALWLNCEVSLATLEAMLIYGFVSEYEPA